MRYCTSIGIDAHKKKNVVCAIVADTGEVVRSTFSSDPRQIVRWINENDFPAPVRCVYESGPCGFTLARALQAANIECVIAATSKLPRRTDRQKTDRRDAEWLARQLLAGAVHAVFVPTLEQESLCHLSRLRAEAVLDLRRAKQRVNSFLLLTSTSYTLTKNKWTKAFYAWSNTYEFACPADTFVFRQKVAEVIRLETRLSEIEDEIERTIKQDEILQARMERLMCIHGIGRITAFSLVCEVYDFTRFKNGAAFASFIGVVPSENSSGEKIARGGIAKTGNSHLRRLIIEAASCYSKRAKAIKEEDLSIPAPVRATAAKCKARLYKRREYLRTRNIKPCKAKVAIARELCEWIYYIMVM